VVILRDDFPPVFRIELACDGSRADEVAEKDGELPPLTLSRSPGKRGPTVSAEPFADLVRRAACTADLTEAAAAFSTKPTIGAVRVAAGGALHRDLFSSRDD